MRKFLLLTMLFVLIGCTGINTSVMVNTATDTAFVLALQNNPQLKSDVISSIGKIKTFLTGSVTYDMLIAEVAKQFIGPYASIGIILSGYIETDKPISTSVIPLLDSYKSAVIKKLDRFIMLTNAT